MSNMLFNMVLNNWEFINFAMLQALIWKIREEPEKNKRGYILGIKDIHYIWTILVPEGRTHLF